MTNEYVKRERQRAARWKSSTTVLPQAARAHGKYVSRDGKALDLPFCLPADLAEHNLLPDVRSQALSLFTELGIPWHAGIGSGPGNHLLSSQVQCVNALAPMVDDPARIVRAFGGVLDIAEVLEIEPGRFLTFEYIGPEDYLNEAKNGLRIRGAHCTSVDAAFRYRTGGGEIELALVEWKFTEEYRKPRKPDPVRDQIRAGRYGELLADPEGAIKSDVLPFEALLDEPLYQLVRQQLLAWELEKRHVLDASTVRVVHVLAPDNTAYQESMVRDDVRQVGDSIGQVWSALHRRPDRFVKLDPEAFLDEEATSRDYVLRYAPDVVWSPKQLLAALEISEPMGLEDSLDWEGTVDLTDEGIELVFGRVGTVLPFPFRLGGLFDLVGELEDEFSD